MTAPRALVSLGCPSGIGPEVSLVAALEPRRSRVLLVGDYGAVVAAALGRRVDPSRIVRVRDPEAAWRLPKSAIPVWQPTADLTPTDRRPGAPTRLSGAAQLAWIDAACDRVARGEGDALITGPVSKEQIVLSKAPGSRGFLGHTEHLQRRLGAREVVMAFWSPALVTSLATTHLPLSRVPRALTAPLVSRATFWLAWLLARLSARTPRLAVASLNPHAGEGGLLGNEERDAIAPGIAAARTRLAESAIRATIDGPVPAETAFRLAHAGRWGGVVAMYHDQATIPMKLVGFGDAVNVSLGLPIVRTSVDHGTAYDRAAAFDADARGMIAAIDLAARLARPRASATATGSATASASASATATGFATAGRRPPTRARAAETRTRPRRSA
jgi:4-hydroxythreonine-4-phosphate dehydrogenase